MRLSIPGLAVAASILWGGLILLVGLANLVWPDYGLDFLRLVSSIYPGYHLDQAGSGVFIATLYGLVDGTVGGAILAWVYNLFVTKSDSSDQ